MSMASFKFESTIVIFVYVIMQVDNGQSVNVVFEPSEAANYCPGETLEYNCTGYGLLLELAAPPYIETITYTTISPVNSPSNFGSTVTAVLTSVDRDNDNPGNATFMATITIRLPLDASGDSFVRCNATTREGVHSMNSTYSIEGKLNKPNISLLFHGRSDNGNSTNVSIRWIEVEGADRYLVELVMINPPAELSVDINTYINDTQYQLVLPFGLYSVYITAISRCQESFNSFADLQFFVNESIVILGANAGGQQACFGGLISGWIVVVITSTGLITSLACNYHQGNEIKKLIKKKNSLGEIEIDTK